MTLKHNTRSLQTQQVLPRAIILVEGILIFADPRLRDLFDVRIYVDAAADICFIRRLQRDIKERGRSVDSIVQQYLKTVRPSLIEFVEPSKRYADLIVPEGGMNQVTYAMVTSGYVHCSVRSKRCLKPTQKTACNRSPQSEAELQAQMPLPKASDTGQSGTPPLTRSQVLLRAVILVLFWCLRLFYCLIATALPNLNTWVIPGYSLFPFWRMRRC